MSTKINWDALGIATSVACAIHCAILPVLITTLPFFGINILHNAFFEWGMITLACLIGSFSLLHGYRKHHRSLTPLYIFLTGFIFLVLKQFFASLEYWFLAVAVIGIVTAHFYNYRLCHQGGAAETAHKH
jgi:MerC mercury resistance protein